MSTRMFFGNMDERFLTRRNKSSKAKLISDLSKDYNIA